MYVHVHCKIDVYMYTARYTSTCTAHEEKLPLCHGGSHIHDRAANYEPVGMFREYHEVGMQRGAYSCYRAT